MSGSLTKADYPANWPALRIEVLRLADHRCQCTGECGSDHAVWGIPGHRCDIPNHARIVRDPVTPALWWHEADAPRHPQVDAWKVVRCVLTIAHLCQDSTCDKLACLRAFCQRCHLTYDAKQHAANGAKTRRALQEAARQLTLLPGSGESVTSVLSHLQGGAHVPLLE